MRPLSLRLSLAIKLLCALAASAIVGLRFVPIWEFFARDPITNAFFQIRRSGYWENFNLAWSLVGHRRIPLGVLVAYALLVFVLCAIPARLWNRVPALRNRTARRDPRASRIWPGWIALGAFGFGAIVSWLLCVSYDVNYYFGDAAELPDELVRGKVAASEPGTEHVFQLARWLLQRWTHTPADDIPAGVASIHLVDYLMGGVFFASMALFALAVGRGLGERLTLFLGCSMAAATGMFFGYVETTQVELACCAAFFAASARVFTQDAGGTTGVPPALTRARVGAFAAAGWVSIAHGAGALLWPSLLWLGADGASLRRDGLRRTLQRLVSLDNALLAVSLVLFPYFFTVTAPFFIQANVGNATGGGDGIAWVPKTVDYAHRVSKWVYYARFSRWHLLDVANAVWLAAPFALPFIVVCGAIWLRRRVRLTKREMTLLGFLATAAGFCAIIPLLWNHDFSVWGDWNLATAYLFPLHVLGWVAFVVFSRRVRRDTAFYGGVVAPLILVQIGSWAGLLAQLYGPAPY